MSSTQRRYSKEEFARRGDAVFESGVRPHLKPEDNGKFVAIDIESGAYEIEAMNWRPATGCARACRRRKFGSCEWDRSTSIDSAGAKRGAGYDHGRRPGRRSSHPLDGARAAPTGGRN